jgi:multiple sugar transport system permease protein
METQEPELALKSRQGTRNCRLRARHRLGTVVLYVLLIALAVPMVVPFYWMLVSSLKEPSDIFSFPPQWWPNPIRFDAYPNVIESFPVMSWGFNSLKIAVLNILGQLVSCSLAAYAFARLKFRGRDTIFMILLTTMMIPGQVTLVPQFIIMRYMGLIDTHLALILPALFGGAFATFLLRQYFRAIPLDLEDAARIDGCSSFGIYWRIFLPLSKPALATISLFTFMWTWNDLISPVVYLQSREKFTLTIGLAYLRGRAIQMTPWDQVFAGAVLTTLPLIILFVAAQRYFVQGLLMSGLKL